MLDSSLCPQRVMCQMRPRYIQANTTPMTRMAARYARIDAGDACDCLTSPSSATYSPMASAGTYFSSFSYHGSGFRFLGLRATPVAAPALAGAAGATARERDGRGGRGAVADAPPLRPF